MQTKLMLLIRSLLFYFGYYVATFIVSCICLLVSWVLPFEKRFFLYSLWCQFILFWLRVCCGITVNITGLENVPRTPVVVISNHQSEWETIFLYYLATPVCPILKKELLNIPFWGWAMRLQKPIAIDRKKPHEAIRSLLTQGKVRIKEFRLSVVIFPEGTRSQPGSVRKFTRGGATLAKETDTPILPIAHDAGNCWPPRQITKYPGEINIFIGNVVHAEDQSPKEITEDIEEWVRNTLSSRC